MSLLLLIQSQTQLQEGLPWALSFANTTQRSITIGVTGSNRTALIEHVRSVVSEIESVGKVLRFGKTYEEISAEIIAAKCRRVLMVDDPTDDAIQRSWFENAKVQTIWLRVKSSPPQTTNQTLGFDHRSRANVLDLSHKWLGFVPALELCDSSQYPETEAKQSAASDSVPAEIDVDGVVAIAKAAEAQRCDEGDLIWFWCDDIGATSYTFVAGLHLMAETTKASIALVRPGDSIGRSIHRSWSQRFRSWAAHVAEPMDRAQRIELSESLQDGAQPNLEFLGLISASSMLAAFGLLQDSAAVIIGAMLIAPLMTPILGAGLALTHGNRPLMLRSVLAIMMGFAGAWCSSFLFGCLVRLTQGVQLTAEMSARSHPSPLDFCVGLVGGMAASYARTRSHLSSALAGAAIAAALVPPIATSGLQTAFGEWKADGVDWPIVGPILLVSINVLTIMIGSSFVLYARGMRIDRRGKASQKWPLRIASLILGLLLLALVAVM
ncbi:MAG: DUF389 domain-containing protein [Planctomycetota bacterium]